MLGASDSISTSSIVVGSFVTVANAGYMVIDGYGVGSDVGGQLFEMRLVLLQIA
jgi:hypothetical protein